MVDNNRVEKKKKIVFICKEKIFEASLMPEEFFFRVYKRSVGELGSEQQVR